MAHFLKKIVKQTGILKTYHKKKEVHLVCCLKLKPSFFDFVFDTIDM